MLTIINRWFERLSSGEALVEKPVNSSPEQKWDTTVDVAVVGFGGAGASAAIEARKEGASVAVVERFNGGGSTKISGGIVYAGGGTSVQLEAGIEDSPDNMYNYLLHEASDAVSNDTLRQFCEGSADNIEWLKQQGVPFNASLCPFKTSYPSNQYYLYYSGNESFSPYTNTATPAPRGHRAHGKGVSGAALFNPLRQSVERAGAQILTQHKVTGLIKSEEGEVLGLEMSRMPPGKLSTWLHKHLYNVLIYLRYLSMYMPPITWCLRALLLQLELRFGEIKRLRARKGVIISSGGFFYNRTMVRQYAPENLPGIPLGTIGDDGSGILMGQGMGAKTDLMDNISDWRFVNPPQSFISGILVDANGQRVCNEMLYGAQLAEQINTKANGQAWLLIDAALAKQALSEIGPSRAMWFQSAAALMYLYLARRKAPTLELLAGKLKIPPEVLQQTVEIYNQTARTRADDPMGKPTDYCKPLESGPWYALDCRINGIMRNPSITLGGLVVDETSSEVLAEDGNKIPGLYAAGRSAVGVASHSYVSGLSIAGCIFSGRRAGRHAAQREA